MSATNWVDVHVEEVIRATDGAFLCEIDGEEIWLPRSQVDGEIQSEGDSGDIQIPEWLAREKGL